MEERLGHLNTIEVETKLENDKLQKVGFDWILIAKALIMIDLAGKKYIMCIDAYALLWSFL